MDTAIPHRIKDGYGLNEHLVEEAHRDGIDTIVTCDNGIAASEQIALAKEYGMTVIVTDHHEIPYEEETDTGSGEARRHYILPPADVVIDPKQDGDLYPFRENLWRDGGIQADAAFVCKNGAAGLTLPDKASAQPGSAVKQRSVLDELMEFAAFATICDVMPLRDENRLIVKHGLMLMQKYAELFATSSLMEVN